MTTTPRIGAPELVSGQATPETTVNEQIRFCEQGSSLYPVKDKDLATPPGSPADGDAYIVASSPTGAWSGWANRIAFYESTAWQSITPVEGCFAYAQDENKLYYYNGSAWADYIATGSIPTEATNSNIWAGSSTTTFLSPAKLYTASAPVALTSSATITPDGNNGFNFSLTLDTNATLANPSNFKTGQSGVIVITQDGTGSRTLAYGTNWKFPGGSPVLSTAAAAVDVISYFVAGASQIIANLSKAYS